MAAAAVATVATTAVAAAATAAAVASVKSPIGYWRPFPGSTHAPFGSLSITRGIPNSPYVWVRDAAVQFRELLLLLLCHYCHYGRCFCTAALLYLLSS
jgi:hypothetical protein